MNIFKTYVISLRRDKERRDWMLSIKDKIGLNFDFFNAVTSEDITEVIKNAYFSHTDFHEWNIDDKAVMATFMSHISLLNMAVKSKTNLLVIEDDIDIVNSFDWNSINFDEFDLFSLGTKFGCYAYFVSYKGAESILEHFSKTKITQAYDWELAKINHLNFKFVDEPVFVQTNKFVSNIAPNGYQKK